MTKEELYQQVKAGKISINDVREKLGHERVENPLMNTTKTNQELLSEKKTKSLSNFWDIYTCYNNDCGKGFAVEDDPVGIEVNSCPFCKSEHFEYSHSEQWNRKNVKQENKV
jgi:predicted Zn-ribbon and HTH transcriptional regulator